MQDGGRVEKNGRNVVGPFDPNGPDLLGPFQAGEPTNAIQQRLSEERSARPGDLSHRIPTAWIALAMDHWIGGHHRRFILIQMQTRADFIRYVRHGQAKLCCW